MPLSSDVTNGMTPAAEYRKGQKEREVRYESE